MGGLSRRRTRDAKAESRKGTAGGLRLDRGAARSRASLATKPLLSVDEVAVLLGLNRSSVYRSAQRGDLPLPVFAINGRAWVPRRAVERLLEGSSPEDGAAYEDEPDDPQRQRAPEGHKSHEPSAAVRRAEEPGGRHPTDPVLTQSRCRQCGEARERPATRDRIATPARDREAPRHARQPDGPPPVRHRCSDGPCAPWTSPAASASELR